MICSTPDATLLRRMTRSTLTFIRSRNIFRRPRASIVGGEQVELFVHKMPFNLSFCYYVCSYESDFSESYMKNVKVSPYENE